MSNQLHWKDFEKIILEHYKTKETSNTSMFDMSFWFNNLPMTGSIKTVKDWKNPIVCLSDVRRIFSWFDTLYFKTWNRNSSIYFVVWLYEQKWSEKHIHTVYEFIIKDTDRNRKFLYGELSMQEVTAFHNSIKLDFFGENEYEEARIFASNIKKKLNEKAWILKLNPKIDSKRQRRLQCSFSLNNFIEQISDSDISYRKHTTNFLSEKLPIIINSNERIFNKNK